MFYTFFHIKGSSGSSQNMQITLDVLNSIKSAFMSSIINDKINTIEKNSEQVLEKINDPTKKEASTNILQSVLYTLSIIGQVQIKTNSEHLKRDLKIDELVNA